MIPIKHFGDITKIDGRKVPPVDVLTGGSPCQDLSVAGRRAGLSGERSGLFIEQIRIVKEMRDECRKQQSINGSVSTVCNIKPRFLVWENVVGAYSSGNPEGADFQAVLEEIVGVVLDEVPTIPIPADGWPYAGNIEGVANNNTPFSVCWRTHDAQYWGKTVIDNCGRVVKAGTPQRRRRIALVADFGGYSAPEILFERTSVSGNTEQGRTQGQGTPGTVGESTEKSGTIRVNSEEPVQGCDGGGYQAGYMLDKTHESTPCVTPNIVISKQLTTSTSDIAVPIEATDYKDAQTICYGFEPGVAQRLDPENRFSEEVSPTLRAKMGDNQASVAYLDTTHPDDVVRLDDVVSSTMASDSHGTPHAVCYGISPYDSHAMKSTNPNSGIYKADTSRTLDNNGGNPACNQGGMIVLEGNGSRPSHKGDGYSESETMYTLNATEQHAVCCSAPTSDKSVEGVDVYNFAITGEVGRTVATAGGGLNEHIPCVIDNTDRPIKESVKTYGVTTKGNGDAFISEERHTSLSTGGGEAGQGYPCVLTPNTYQDTTGALCASGYSKLGTQEASNDMYVVQEPTAWDGGQVSPTLTANNADGSQRMPDKDHFNAVVQCMEVLPRTDRNEISSSNMAGDYKDSSVVAIDMGGGKSSCSVLEETSPTLATTHYGEPAILSTGNTADVVCIENHPNDSRIKVRYDGTVQTLSGRMGTGGNNTPMVMSTEPQAFSQNQREEIRDLGDKASSVSAEPGTHQQTFVSTAVVRRLTPIECELLQGFPRNWTLLGEWTDTQGKKHKDADSARYKALGNSLCLPFWSWMAGRMCEQLRKSGIEQPTMASLFDGIAGFPLVYARHNCKPVWCSEIEEFPIAVCKKHFGDDDTGEKGDYEQYLHQTEPFYKTNTSKVVYGLDRASFNQGQNALYDFSIEEDKAQTLVARGPGGVCQ